MSNNRVQNFLCPYELPINNYSMVKHFIEITNVGNCNIVCSNNFNYIIEKFQKSVFCACTCMRVLCLHLHACSVLTPACVFCACTCMRVLCLHLHACSELAPACVFGACTCMRVLCLHQNACSVLLLHLQYACSINNY